MLAIMAGATQSALGGWTGQALIPVGETFNVQQNVQPRSSFAGRSIGKSGSFNVDVREFNIDNNPDGSIGQFRSKLVVRDSRGAEVTRKEISVNDPLRIGGVSGLTMYQADWGVASVRVRVSGLDEESKEALGAALGATGAAEGLAESDEVLLDLPMRSLEGTLKDRGRVWGAALPLSTGGGRVKGLTLLAQDLQGTLVYNPDGSFLGVGRPGGKVLPLPGLTGGLEVLGLTGSSGIELKADPGVPLVYVGFGALMLTTALSLGDFSEVWAAEDGDAVNLGGRANRRLPKELREELVGVAKATRPTSH